jgi:hydrogenase maturation protease
LSITLLILGIGNNLLSDEGVGVHVVQHLQARETLPAGVTLMDGGTLSFTLAEPIAQADALIVVDAARLDAAPGTIRVVEGEAMDAFLRGARNSVHEVSLADLMDMARLTGDLPQRRCLVGIQPESLDWGEAPSAAVAAAIPAAARQVREIALRWLGATA